MTLQHAPEHGAVSHGEHTFPYTITRSRKRRKTVGIVLGEGGAVRVSAPVKLSVADVQRIVQGKARWIARRTAEDAQRPAPIRFRTGETLPYLGRQVPLVVEAEDNERVHISLHQWTFRITVPESLRGERRREAIRAALTDWYKRRAADRIASRVHHWTPETGCRPRRLLIRDQRERWGSCAIDGTLRFNWRLVMTPPALLDYVVVHELLHLKVRSHAPSFWRRVEAVLPDYKERRARLIEAGRRLPI